MSLMNTIGLTCPIVQAPMAGGATTPELIAAVSNSGGLGSLGAGMTAPEVINTQINQIRRLTSRPFGVNLMVLSAAESTTLDTPMPDWLQAYYSDNAIDIDLPDNPAHLFSQQLQVLLDNPVAVASFTFGIINEQQVKALQDVGTKVVGTVNHPIEACAWADIGADAVCVQGMEAGGHRGGWLAASEQDPLGLLTLISQTQAITDIPLIAAGGIMTGKAIKAVQQAGVELAQLGTAFLTTNESGISPTYKNALLQVANSDYTDTDSGVTRLTRLFSGKLARGLVNDYLQTYAKYDCLYDNNTLPPYPQLNAMTKPMRANASKLGDAEHLSLWAGQGVRLVQAESVQSLMQRLLNELNA